MATAGMRGEFDSWPQRLMTPKEDYSVVGEQLEHSKQRIAEPKRQKAEVSQVIACPACVAAGS